MGRGRLFSQTKNKAFRSSESRVVVVGAGILYLYECLKVRKPKYRGVVVGAGMGQEANPQARKGTGDKHGFSSISRTLRVCNIRPLLLSRLRGAEGAASAESCESVLVAVT